MILFMLPLLTRRSLQPTTTPLLIDSIITNLLKKANYRKTTSCTINK